MTLAKASSLEQWDESRWGYGEERRRRYLLVTLGVNNSFRACFRGGMHRNRAVGRGRRVSGVVSPFELGNYGPFVDDSRWASGEER